VSLLAGAADREWGAGAVELMNAAVGGWGTAEYVAFLEDRGQSIPPPRAILVFLSGDETRRSLVSGLWTLAPDGTLTRQSKAASAPALRSVAVIPGYRYLVEHSHLAALIRSTVVNRLPAAPTEPPPDAAARQAENAKAVALNTALVQRLQHWSVARGVPLWIVATGFVNLREHAADDQTVFAVNRQFSDRAAAVFAAAGIPYLDLVPNIERAIDRSPEFRIPTDLHPSEAGARLVADLSWPWLKDRLATLKP
jgi:hypothetical protein